MFRKLRNSGRYYIHGKLSTWIQRRCIICQRFLSKRQEKYCAECYPIAQTKNQTLNHRNDLEFKNYDNLRCRVYRNADRFNIGDII